MNRACMKRSSAPAEETRQVADLIATAMERGGIDPDKIYAFVKTGRMLTVQGLDSGLYTDEQLDEWNAAIDEYRAAHPAAKGAGA